MEGGSALSWTAITEDVFCLQRLVFVLHHDNLWPSIAAVKGEVCSCSPPSISASRGGGGQEGSGFKSVKIPVAVQCLALEALLTLLVHSISCDGKWIWRLPRL